jgi:hypothetical protein
VSMLLVVCGLRRGLSFKGALAVESRAALNPAQGFRESLTSR